MRAASAASRIRRRALAAPRSTSLEPDHHALLARQLLAALPQPLHRGRARRGQRGDRAHAVVAGVEERARVEPAAGGSRTARPGPASAGPSSSGRRRAHGVEEHVRAAEVAARLGRLGLGRLHRAGGQRLEHVLDDVLGGQPLDQLGLLQPHRGLVRHGAQELGVLVVEGAARAQCSRGCPSCSSPAASGATSSSSSTAPVRPPRIRSSSCAARAGPSARRRADPRPPGSARRPRGRSARSGTSRRRAAGARRA